MKLVALAMCLCTAAYAATPDEDGAVYELSEATNDDFSYTVMLSMLNERMAMCLCTAAYAATPDEDGAVYELSEATNDDFSYTVMLCMLNERMATCLCTAAYAATPDEDGAVYELSEATNDDFSYTVMLSMLNERNNIVNYCAGARISVEWFLTAAECLNQTNVSKFVLTYTKRTSDYLPIPFELKSVKHQIHPKYDQNTKTNNLALLRCEQCGRQGPKQIPKLPSPNDASTVYSGESAIVTGISKNQATNFQKFDMHFLKTKILSPFWCKLSYFSPYFGTNRICASNWGHQGLSEADVGAPLVLAGGSDGSVKLVGVATSVEFWSTVFPIPMVFTKVAPHVDWIRTVTSAV